MNIVIHHNPAIPWQRARVGQMKAGLETLGFFVRVTQSRTRINDAPAVLFGTSAFQAVESAPGNWLLVDRACWGDPDYVRLGWNGRDLRADYRIVDDSGERWEQIQPKFDVGPEGSRVVLCGDYDAIPDDAGDEATHFRPHPAPGAAMRHDLPVVHDFEDAALAIVGRSSVAFEAIQQGVMLRVTDPQSMANLPHSTLAHTQWHWNEIEAGEPIRHLFEWLR